MARQAGIPARRAINGVLGDGGSPFNSALLLPLLPLQFMGVVNALEEIINGHQPLLRYDLVHPADFPLGELLADLPSGHFTDVLAFPLQAIQVIHYSNGHMLDRGARANIKLMHQMEFSQAARSVRRSQNQIP